MIRIAQGQSSRLCSASFFLVRNPNISWLCYALDTLPDFIAPGLNIAFRPWENRTSRAFETLCLGFLAVLSASCAPQVLVRRKFGDVIRKLCRFQLTKLQLGSSKSIWNERNLEILQLTISVLPSVCYLCLTTARSYKKISAWWRIRRASVIVMAREQTGGNFEMCLTDNLFLDLDLWDVDLQVCMQERLTNESHSAAIC